jgi:hypothetical protein
MRRTVWSKVRAAVGLGVQQREGGGRIDPARGLGQHLARPVRRDQRHVAARLHRPQKLGQRPVQRLEILQDEMAEDEVEALAIQAGDRVHIALDARDPLRHTRLGGVLAELLQHRRGRIEHGDAVTGEGQGQGVAAIAAADVEDAPGAAAQPFYGRAERVGDDQEAQPAPRRGPKGAPLLHPLVEDLGAGGHRGS